MTENLWPSLPDVDEPRCWHSPDKRCQWCQDEPGEVESPVTMRELSDAEEVGPMTEDELGAIEAAFHGREMEQAAAARGGIFRAWHGGLSLVAEVRRLRRILAAVADEVKLQSAYLHLYSDRIKIEEFDDREALLETFGNLASGIGPDGHEIE